METDAQVIGVTYLTSFPTGLNGYTVRFLLVLAETM